MRRQAKPVGPASAVLATVAINVWLRPAVEKSEFWTQHFDMTVLLVLALIGTGFWLTARHGDKPAPAQKAYPNIEASLDESTKAGMEVRRQ